VEEKGINRLNMDPVQAVEALPPTQPTGTKASNIQIYYALPHMTISSAINIINLDPYLKAFLPITRADLEADPKGTIPESLGLLQKEAKTVVADIAPTPWLTCTKKGFMSSRYVVSSQAVAALAEMTISAWWGASAITFNRSSVAANSGNDVATAQGAGEKPEATQAPRLPITIESKHWYSREMTFVIDSILYKWGMDSNWHSRRFTLYKGVQACPSSKKDEAQGGEVCAKCLIGWTSWTSATIVVDAEKIDPLTAVLTVLPVLFRIKANRQARE
jgi:hypothetical protein